MQSTTVVAFPLSRQQGILKGLADVLRSKQGEDASCFWRDTAKTLLRNLIDRGMDARSAENEVRNLLYAVLAEMETDAQVREG